MPDVKHNLRFMLSATEVKRAASPADEAWSPRPRGEFSRRVHNEKIASVFKRFLVARVAFDAIIETCRLVEPMQFDPIDLFVERTLFGLKEECHALFRKAGRPAGEVLFGEDLFDVLIGSIFHETMKIKENCYILEHYGPAYQAMAGLADRRIQVPGYERLFFRACKRIIERASSAVYDDIRAAQQLFDDATKHLLSMLHRFAGNGLVTRMLIENEQLVDMVYGEDGLRMVLLGMYDDHLDSAYLHAANSYLDAGRFDEARKYCEKSLQENKDNLGAQLLMERIQEKA